MSIEQFEGKNAAGIKKIHLIKHSSASFDPKPSLRQVVNYADDIVCTEDWTTITAIPNSYNWTETQSNTAGQSFTYQLEFLINKDRPAITAALLAINKFKLLVLIEDNNGQIRLLGGDQNWCKISYSQTKEARLSGSNLYRFQVECIQPFPAIYYTGAISSS
jgi:hypothetical protein